MHPASGFRFPARIDRFVRVGGERYAADNLSVRYELAGANGAAPWLTIYVYPAAVPLPLEAQGVREAIVRRWPTRPFADAPATPAGVEASGWYEADVAGVASVTTFALAQRHGWSIKLRMTGPRDPPTVALFTRTIAAVEWDAALAPRRHKPSAR